MKGFSLLEIMVVVAVIGIMAASVAIGFNAFGETVEVRETAGVVADTFKRLELEILRRDFQKSTVNFEDDYMVVESVVDGSSLPIEYDGPTCDGNPEASIYVDNTAGGDTVFLAQRDQYDNNLQVTPVGAGNDLTVCADFLNADETEWRFQVFKDGQVSNVIRLMHFNVRRNDLLGSNVTITDGTQYSLEIAAPYGKETVYEGVNEVNGQASITFEKQDSTETLTLQE